MLGHTIPFVLDSELELVSIWYSILIASKEVDVFSSYEENSRASSSFIPSSALYEQMFEDIFYDQEVFSVAGETETLTSDSDK